MNEDTELARFQTLLLELLDTELSPHEIHRRLLDHEAAAPFRDYVRNFEPRCIEIGSLLVRKWGVRRPTPKTDDRSMERL
jgi:hypothetical protein